MSNKLQVKKSHETLYHGDQRSNQRFLGITANSSRPPVVALTFDKTKLSASCGMYIAPLKMTSVIGLPELTLTTIPLRMLSQVRPTIIEGRKTLISPLRFRTEGSVRVLTRR